MGVGRGVGVKGIRREIRLIYHRCQKTMPRKRLHHKCRGKPRRDLQICEVGGPWCFTRVNPEMVEPQHGEDAKESEAVGVDHRV